VKHRILFYSHDTFGLGHFRRSLTIASHLTRHVENVAVLMLTGLDSAAAFEPAAGIDFVKLPGVWKSGREEYRSRHLKVSFQRVRRIRRELVRGVVRAFDPHLLVVDNSPRGVGGELMSTLRYLRERRPETRIALTMRDVIDRPDHVNAHWHKVGMLEVLEQYYDEIWIAGARAVFDPPDLYDFSETLRKRTRYCGYVVRSSSRADVDRVRRELNLDERPRVLISCGGGGDGYQLMDAWTQVASNFARYGIDSIVLLGPDMPLAQRRELRARLLPLGDRVVVFDFSPDVPALLAASTVSVSMAGYNTVCEIVSTGRPALLVPRSAPRDEQWMRAKALQDLDLVSVLRPDSLTPATLEDGVRKLIVRAAGGWAPSLPEGLDFAGATRIGRRVRKHLSLPAMEDDAA
jgi:predicted glycosyltransferase